MKDFIKKYLKKYKLGIILGIFISLLATIFIIYTSFLPDSPIRKEPCFDLQWTSTITEYDCSKQSYSQSLELLVLPFEVTMFLSTYPILIFSSYTHIYLQEIISFVGIITNSIIWGTVGFVVQVYLKSLWKFWKEKY